MSFADELVTEDMGWAYTEHRGQLHRTNQSRIGALDWNVDDVVISDRDVVDLQCLR